MLHTISHLNVQLSPCKIKNVHYCNVQTDTWYRIEKRKKYGTEMKSKTTHRGHPSTTVIKGLIN